MMKSFKFCFALVATALLTACAEDDLFTGTTDDGTTGNGTTSTTTTNGFTILEQTPTLPNTPYNYANLNLPNYLETNQIRNQDNTPNNNPVTDAGATLGRVLFYDKNVSANNAISCASCHNQADGFSDTDQFSVGFEGERTGRNSMGLAQSAYYENGRFFWDERASTLEEQVLMPIEDHIEMGMTLEDLVNKLDEISYYETLFIETYGDETITADRIARAMAQFIRSMVSYNSKFDEGLQQLGNNQNFANTPFPNFTASENLGKNLFFSNRTNCDNCHGSANFVAPNARNNGLDVVYADNGVGAVNGNANDNGDFKVGSLRNIALTAPYMHDGRFVTLEQVIEHYNSGVQAHPNLSPQLRQGGGNGQPRRLNLTNAEKTALVDFLETLTDPVFTTDPKYSDPFNN